MGTLSLDANVLIDLVHGRKPVVRDRYLEAQLRGDTLVMSSLVWEELQFGASRARSKRSREVLAALMEPVAVLPFDREDARVTAELRADLERRGERIGSYDTLIAGHALARGWTMVTANVREFGRVQALEVIDWTAPGPVRQE